MKKLLSFLTLQLLFFGSFAQVRPNITSFSPAQRTQLATLMQQYITPQVIEYHCIMTMGIDDIHSDFNFLPFHRVYIEKMEDWLMLQPNGAQFVPLPYWNPALAGGLPIELRVVDPDCSAANCMNGDPSSICTQTINWNPGNTLPQNLSLPVVPGLNNDICDHLMKPLLPMLDNNTFGSPKFTGDGLSRRIETPWHNSVHQTMEGVMLSFRSPALPAFFLWHAYVDDVWKSWECNCTQSGMIGSSDLYSKDNNFVVQKERDRGQEPNIDLGPMWESKDIWVRKQNDGFTNQTHENPEYYALPSNFNYVYVRVRNRGCVPNVAGANLNLNWAKAGTALAWPNHWNGSITSPALMGNLISTKPIPVIQPGKSAIIEFAWQPPNPATYASIGTNPMFWANEPWHFCLLARIVSPNDPMTFTETSDLNSNVRNNNNIVWKNISVVDETTTNSVNSGGEIKDDLLVGATIIGGDAWGTGGLYDFEFTDPTVYQGNPVTAEAEIKITLDELLWVKWANGGFQGTNIEIVREEKHQIIVKGNKGSIKNLLFAPNERGLLHVSFNFLVKKLSGQPEFDYRVIQRKSLSNEIVGGETYHIKIKGREGFYANAGNDLLVSQHDNINLNANDIGEPAIYNWYDSDGNLIYTGKDFSVSAEITEKYKLEVIALADGVKDYDEIEIKVKDAEIVAMSPNPASTSATITYKIVNASSAYLILTRPYSGQQNQYIVNTSLNSTSINVSSLTSGVYSVILVCDGVAKDVKSLIIQ
jgi:hypothetical protein